MSESASDTLDSGPFHTGKVEEHEQYGRRHQHHHHNQQRRSLTPGGKKDARYEPGTTRTAMSPMGDLPAGDDDDDQQQQQQQQRKLSGPGDREATGGGGPPNSAAGRTRYTASQLLALRDTNLSKVRPPCMDDPKSEKHLKMISMLARRSETPYDEDGPPAAQTDDTAVEEPADKPPGQTVGEQDDKDVKANQPATKVLALLECTPENLQRLQRKLEAEGGALCLDERLLRLDDDDEAERDKAMQSNKQDGTADPTRFLTVWTDPKEGESISVSYVWLRDHCQCEECYNVATFQRSTSILDLPLDIQPALCNVTDSKIEIVWQDGHLSSYQLRQVVDNHVDNYRKRLEERRAQLVLWDRALIAAAEHPPSYARVTLNDLLCEDSVMRQVVGSLITYGFAFITKVPPNQQSTEMAVKRIFPVQRTLFGDMWTFSESKMDHSDTAYTNGFLGPHTDNTYFSDAAGLQVLHCIQFNGRGGETLLVDGYAAADRLRESDPAAYDRLCEYPLEAEYIEEDKHHRYVAPVIKRHRVLTGAVEQIRFNPYDRAPMRTLAAAEVPQFYADYRKLAEELYREEVQWKFQLTPGTVLIFDNWRVLHGRMAYSGKRVMTGCYVARTEYQSVARTMGLIE